MSQLAKKTGAVNNQAHEFAEISEDSLALEFTKRHGDNFRYVAEWGRWLKWNGSRWVVESTLEVFDLARAVCRDEAAKTDSPKAAAIIRKSSTIAAIEKLARADRKHAATVEIWDADPWMLQTPTCVIDLRTMKSSKPRPDGHMMRSTAVGPSGDCPTWLVFLDRITGGNVELQKFLQRIAGYSLTGSTRDHAVFFAYGTGGNGKGVFIDTISAILGDYSHVAPIKVFTASKYEQHSTSIAALNGPRFVSSQEVEEGRQWAETRLKELTGGSQITANFMRQDEVTFTPRFKLLIAGNHKPGLQNVDEAIRRRLHLVPFAVTIPASKRDPLLFEKLKAEWPGILQWMLAGCAEWRSIGLAPPEIVANATAEYLEEEDSISKWMHECLDPESKHFESHADLYGSWKQWAVRAGLEPRSGKWFSQTFVTKGATKSEVGHDKRVRFNGYRLKYNNISLLNDE